MIGNKHRLISTLLDEYEACEGSSPSARTMGSWCDHGTDQTASNGPDPAGVGPGCGARQHGAPQGPGAVKALRPHLAAQRARPVTQA